MKKIFLLFSAALVCAFMAGCEREEFSGDGGCVFIPENAFDLDGASKSLFSVADGRQVRFSQGNLQYCAVGTRLTVEDTAMGVFRFAAHQYDYLGDDNAMVSATNTGWIDLFCWGSSGWHVEPWSEKDGNYDIESLCGDEAYADWGVYNAIDGGGPVGQWRTLTRDEWDYLINRRAASNVDGTDSARYAEATVCGIAGLIVFPDNFERPEHVDSVVNINCNSFTFGYSDNVYDADEWTLMERAGAVFLPAAGFRGGTWLSTVGEGGSYWASTCNSDRQAYALLFTNGLVNASAVSTYDKDRGYGRSVRLVKDADKL